MSGFSDSEGFSIPLKKAKGTSNDNSLLLDHLEKTVSVECDRAKITLKCDVRYYQIFTLSQNDLLRCEACIPPSFVLAQT